MSRKGFDVTAGGYPSPIFADRFVPMPIPEAESGQFYKNLKFPKTQDTLLKVMLDLGISQYSEAHLDPDLSLDYHSANPPNWVRSFGQWGSSATILSGVDAGALFLFYGWFRKVEKNAQNEYKYLQESGAHYIYGYLRVTKVVKGTAEIRAALPYHPHSRYQAADKNLLFLGSEGGIFNFSESLRLTAPDSLHRSIWHVPSFFTELPMSGAYELQGSLPDSKKVMIQFKGRNQQELLISDDSRFIEWAENIVSSHTTY